MPQSSDESLQEKNVFVRQINWVSVQRLIVQKPLELHTLTPLDVKKRQEQGVCSTRLGVF